MRNEVYRDLSDSAYDFMRVVWPTMRDLVGGGRIKPVEASAADDMRRDLDMLAGIDAWQMIDSKGVMRGIASRVQWGPNYRSFTIRTDRPNGSKTEKEKRLHALAHPDEGWLFPHLTVQAYLGEPKRKGDLLSLGVVLTRDLYEFVRTMPPNDHKSAGNGGEEFDYYKWDYLRQYKCTVYEMPLSGHWPF